MPFPTEVVQSIQYVQAMTRRKRRAHLYSTRELYSTHVPREEEEEYEEKNTAWLSHQHCHMTRPRQVEPWAPCRTTLWVLLCARELSKLPAHHHFPPILLPTVYWYTPRTLPPSYLRYGVLRIRIQYTFTNRVARSISVSYTHLRAHET